MPGSIRNPGILGQSPSQFLVLLDPGSSPGRLRRFYRFAGFKPGSRIKKVRDDGRGE